MRPFGLIEGKRRADDQLARGVQPILCEAGLKRNSAGTVDANFEIAPMLRILSAAAPMIRYARAAGECDASIDNQ